MNETNHPSSLATCTLIQDLLNVKEGGIYEAVVQLKQQLEAREREVMANGVDKFAEQQEKLAADYRKLSPGCYGEVSSQENALMARAFAVELREGRV